MAQTEIKNIEELAKVIKTAVVDSKNNECCDNVVRAGIIYACPYVDEDYGECSIFNEELKPVKKKVEYGDRYKRCQKCLDNFVVKTDI